MCVWRFRNSDFRIFLTSREGADSRAVRRFPHIGATLLGFLYREVVFLSARGPKEPKTLNSGIYHKHIQDPNIRKVVYYWGSLGYPWFSVLGTDFVRLARCGFRFSSKRRIHLLGRVPFLGFGVQGLGFRV